MSRRIVVTGRVQGVWFRGWTVDQARALGLSGWVRNRRDGSVEILAEGPEGAVTELVNRLHHGPSEARVDRVEVEESGEAAPARFEQRPTL